MKPVIEGIWRRFSAEDWFQIPGRGWCAVTQCPIDWHKNDGPPPGFAVGDEVLIDRRLYVVRGIESYATEFIWAGAPISLLVGEP